MRVLIDFWQADETEARPSLRKLAATAVAGYGQTLKRPATDVAHVGMVAKRAAEVV